MPYKRLRQGEIKNAYFLSYFWMAVRKKDMANKPVKNVFFYRAKFSSFITMSAN